MHRSRISTDESVPICRITHRNTVLDEQFADDAVVKSEELAVVVLRHYLLLLRVSCPAPCHCMLSDNVITTRMEYNKKNYLSVHSSTRCYVLRSTISVDVLGRLKYRNMKYPGTIPIFSYSSTSTSIVLLPS